MLVARHVPHEDSHLTGVDLAPVATPLPLHPDRMPAPLGKAAGIESDDPIGLTQPLDHLPNQHAHQQAMIPRGGADVSALYRRLAARRGKRRAILAVTHAIMGSVFHMLSRIEPYRDLGPNYFDERRRYYTVDRLTSRIEHLGYRVHLEPLPTAAA